MVTASGNETPKHSDLLFIEDQVRMPLMKLPNRCTIVRLSDGQLIVVSPTQNFAVHNVEPKQNAKEKLRIALQERGL